MIRAVTSTAIHHVQANGLRFAYLEEGRGPLVLLLHGFPDTPHTWDAVRPAIAAAGFRAVTPFMRGYAPTEIPAEEAFDADTLGADAIALIEALGEEKAFLVGHDWGASAAYSAAGLAPEKLRMVITMAIPHPASIIPMPKLVWGARHFFVLSRRGAAARIRETKFAYIDRLVRRWSPAWDVPPGETAAVKAALREPGSLEAALGYYRAAPVAPARAAQEGERAGRGVLGGHRHRPEEGVPEGAPPLHGSLRGRAGGGRALHAPGAPRGVHPRAAPAARGRAGAVVRASSRRPARRRGACGRRRSPRWSGP